MPAVEYLIEPSDDDRKNLENIVSEEKSSTKVIHCANNLLASDRNSRKHMTVAEIGR